MNKWVWRAGVAAGITAVLAMAAWSGAQPRSLPLAVHTVRADDAMLKRVRGLGATAVVQVFAWSDIQPSPERWEWEYTDWLVRAANHYGLDVVARLDKPPAWANPSNAAGGGAVLNAPPNELQTYLEFVRRTVERYKGKISGYVIWNEPNVAAEWGNAPPDASAYAELLKRASETIRAADPQAKVVAAGLAPTNENSNKAEDDRNFLRALYAAGARDAFDALAAHPYAFAQPPDASADANNGLNFDRLDAWRAIMQANGDENKPIWITEFGYPTEQPPGFEDRVVTEAQQAEYTRRAYEIARDDKNGVALFTLWNLTRDVPSTDEQYGYGLLRADGSPKPVVDAIRGLQTKSRFDVLSDFVGERLSNIPPVSRVPVLARDTVVHLGDSEYPAPFVPLYHGNNPATEWKGIFYLRPQDLSRRGGWMLEMELMQVNDFDSRVWVNDVPVQPAFLPVEDFTSKWVTARFVIPGGALRAGDNAVSIRDGKLIPALQQPGFTWDEMQVRNVRIVKE